MAKSLNFWSRKTHRWGAVICALPLLLVIGTGVLLQLKKQMPWVQPPTQRGTDKTGPQLSFEEVLSAARNVPEAEIKDWSDIDRLDVRPGKGIVKVRAKNRWEIQLDTKTAKVLSVEYRRSDLIESLHDGSWFHDEAKLWVFLPNGMILLGLWLTGVYLWFLPVLKKRQKATRQRERQATSA